MTYWSRDGLRPISVEEFVADKESRTLARTYLPDGDALAAAAPGLEELECKLPSGHDGPCAGASTKNPAE